MTVYVSASPPLVIHCLVPLRMYLSPFRTAVVWMPPASLPALGSVSANAASFSPVASGDRYFFFCSSEPPIRIGSAPSALAA